MDAKKAMPPDKLAELWNLDPKRAKRSGFHSVSHCPYFFFLFSLFFMRNRWNCISSWCCIGR